ncbi:GTP 3',8-cyclase MoaA [Cellulomonas carbonis]|uniref:GTP 3',8-cyclase n=1 Tax=Cellulomonas carbonis T26 TaxID=947969 RepID=A0A0A0BSZ1_9CELL|nr:GTP 3',8-cyclase MoaA [Cellulomonas carbonis]KGM10777.1 molybdenum cofactor biosynthesis protein MoeA [Cellulomonas carbonis T26]GGB92624.1 cyclic pyranopterin monophosphate synthase [Cellulomonas carbonis]
MSAPGGTGTRARDPLVDRFGRVHQDLRISLTDRCSLRCTYCMPAEGVPWLPGSTVLSTDEIVRITRLAVELGIREVRLTGGEPLLRPDVVDVVRRIAALEGLHGSPEVSITTNALRLPALAGPLKDAGLARVNISIDTLDRERFARLTRRDRLPQTLAGIAAADAVGLHPVKLNAVAMRGVNDDEVVALTQFAVDRGYEMRFIEQMPLDAGHTWDRAQMVTQAEVLAALRTRFRLTEVPTRGSAPAERWVVDDGPATVGVIASVTAPFCGACDRVRLTADGQLRACLFARTETDLRTLIREGADDDALEAAFRTCLAGKRAGHDIDDPTFLQPDRPMSAIGG